MFTQRGKAHSIGRPGSSAWAAYRMQRAKFLNMSWRSRITILALATATGAVLALVSGYSPITGGVLAASVVLAAAVILTTPETLKILLVFFAYAATTFFIGGVYTSAMIYARGGEASNIGDPIGGAALLLAAGLMAIPIAARFSRGRVWLTLVFAYAATLIPGLLIILFFPGFGLYAAYLSMGLALLVRCGGWAWLAGTVALAWNRVRHPEETATVPATKEDVKQVSAWLRRAHAEQETAELLQGLPEEFTVFHDIRVKGNPSALGHLVVGPPGAFLIASVDSSGPVLEDPRYGISLPGIPVDQVVGTLLEQRRLVAKMLHSLERDFSLILVAHGEGLEDTRKTAAAFNPRDPGLPIAQVNILGANELLREVNPGYSIWSAVKIAQTVRRAKMRLGPAPAPAPVKGNTTVALPPVVAGLDNDGNPNLVENTDELPAWLEAGAQVNIYTSKGVLTGLRVVGHPFTDEHGRGMVSLCVEEEWEAAVSAGRTPKVYPYPVRSVSPSA